MALKSNNASAKPNLSKEELRCLQVLKKDTNIKILPADKGNATVLIDTTEYMMYVKRTAKEVIRLEMKKRIAGISTENKNSQSERIATQLFDMPVYKSSTRVGIYLNMDDEVRTTKIVENILDNEKECFIPWYHGNDMKLVKLSSLDDLFSLPKTKWNIPQPLSVEDREDSFTNGGLDLVLVPGLAFTTKGDRLGRGKGFYDRYLQSMMLFREQSGKKLSTIALAFKEQILDSLPNNPLDFVLDDVLYPEFNT